MWFVLVRFTEGWAIQSGPFRQKDVAHKAMLKDATPDGPAYGIAYVESVGRIETYHKWEKIEEIDSCPS